MEDRERKIRELEERLLESRDEISRRVFLEKRVQEHVKGLCV
jgi:hypothetical protein